MADSPQSFLEVIGNTVGSGLKQAGSAVQQNQQNRGANALMMFKLLQEQHDQQLQHQESKLRMDHLRIEIAKSNNELALSTKKLADQTKEGLKIGGLSYADFAPVPLGLDAPENKLPDLGPILAEAGIPLPKNANEDARFGKIVAEHLGPLISSAGAAVGPLDMKALGQQLRASVDAADAEEEQHKIDNDIKAALAKQEAGVTKEPVDAKDQSRLDKQKEWRGIVRQISIYNAKLKSYSGAWEKMPQDMKDMRIQMDALTGRHSAPGDPIPMITFDEYDKMTSTDTGDALDAILRERGL